jgi:hypothetical protein
MIEDFLSEEDSLRDKHLEVVIKFVIDYINVKKGEVTKFNEEFNSKY